MPAGELAEEHPRKHLMNEMRNTSGKKSERFPDCGLIPGRVFGSAGRVRQTTGLARVGDREYTATHILR